jgi:hypothetical protein
MIEVSCRFNQRKTMIIKNYFLLVVVCFAVSSCKPKKSGKDSAKTNSGWSDAEVKRFQNVCLTPGNPSIIPDDKLDAYCACMLTKLQASYTTYEEAFDKGIEDAKTPCLAEIGVTRGNNSSGTTTAWPAADKQKFMEDCVAKPGEEKGGSQEGCSCLLDQAQKYFSSYASFENSSETNPEWKKNGDSFDAALEDCRQRYPRR